MDKRNVLVYNNSLLGPWLPALNISKLKVLFSQWSLREQELEHTHGCMRLGWGLCMCKALANFSAGCNLSAPFLSHDNRTRYSLQSTFKKGCINARPSLASLMSFDMEDLPFYVENSEPCLHISWKMMPPWNTSQHRHEEHGHKIK